MTVCGDCKLDLKPSEFYKDVNRKSGLRWNCKECCKKRNQNSKASIKKYKASEHGRAKIHAYNNSVAGRESKKKWENSEKGKKTIKQSREKLKDWQKEYHRQWRNTKAGRESINRRSRERRALKAKVTVEQFTEKEVLTTYGSCCYICGKNIDLALPRNSSDGLHLDHVIPLSKGGPHSIQNVRPTHAKCNLSKGGSVWVLTT